MAKRREESGVFPSMEQEKVPSIERWIRKCDNKREIINGLKGELLNHELKLAEQIRDNADKVSHEEDPKKGPILVYRRGDFVGSCGRGKEKVNYTVGEKSKGEEPDQDEMIK